MARELHIFAAEEGAMIDEILQTVFEYQLLRAKERMQIELDLEEQVRARALRQCLRGDFINGKKRRCNRFVEPPSVTFTHEGGFGEGRLQDICGSGVAIATTCRLGLGARTVLRVRDDSQGTEYVFPAKVVWRASSTVVGLAFDGAPSRVEGATWSWGPMRLHQDARKLVA